MGWPQTDLRASHRHGRVKRSVEPTRTRQGREVAREGQVQALLGGSVWSRVGHAIHSTMGLMANLSA